MNNFGFIMIKPSGQRYMGEIIDTITKDFQILEIYHIPDWKALVEKLYLHEIQKYGEEFAEDFYIHVWINNYFFGNQAILLKITTNEEASEEYILNKIHKKKKEIRNAYNCTKNGTSMFLINVNMLNIKHKISKNNGTVYLKDDMQIQELDKDFLQRNGRYKTQFLNYVHACNPNINDFKYELDVYSNFKIFDNILTETQLKQCINMRSSCYPL